MHTKETGILVRSADPGTKDGGRPVMAGPFSCPTCGKILPTHRGYSVHMSLAHRMAEAVPIPDATAPDAPSPVRLKQIFGFYDADGTYRQWPEGQVETDPAMIALLRANSAPIDEEC